MGTIYKNTTAEVVTDIITSTPFSLYGSTCKSSILPHWYMLAMEQFVMALHLHQASQGVTQNMKYRFMQIFKKVVFLPSLLDLRVLGSFE